MFFVELVWQLLVAIFLISTTLMVGAYVGAYVAKWWIRRKTARQSDDRRKTRRTGGR
ncbi:hypothetical protein [Herbaspirillum sp.]|uniref:hypothetical protein n=1 Tax=Herbaspirillum sp. TaxID=1890675 RepID=UPI00258BF308|nr:hypothetical protein [Herbaspirillum sp.]MCP3947332.1 hypothetical protein [Herbaspirillum sp.]